MSSRLTFDEQLKRRWREGNTLACVGLDSDIELIPDCIRARNSRLRVARFNCEVVDATHHHACAFKPNIAFYCGEKQRSLQDALLDTIRHIRQVARDVPIILDFKRADIGNTNRGYVQEAFEYFDVDAVTVNPYFGAKAMTPFLEQTGKGIFVLCRTSNEGSDEFQELVVKVPEKERDDELAFIAWPDFSTPQEMPLYEYVAHRVASQRAGWNAGRNCGLVVGATYPAQLARVRQIVGDDMPILVPGVGSQGGDLGLAVTAGVNDRGDGILVNSSRKIIFAESSESFAAAAGAEALKLKNEANSFR